MPTETALITGASSGIGEELTRRFAQDRSNLVLVARSGDNLERLAAELRVKHGIEVEVLVGDLADGQQIRLSIAASAGSYGSG